MNPIFDSVVPSDVIIIITCREYSSSKFSVKFRFLLIKIDKMIINITDTILFTSITNYFFCNPIKGDTFIIVIGYIIQANMYSDYIRFMNG